MGRLIPLYKCRTLKALLCHWFPRYKLRMVCRAIRIQPKDWQKKFALDKLCPFPVGRRSGKTMAVMLRLLMLEPHDTTAVGFILLSDPDWRASDPKRWRWYEHEYRRLAAECFVAGIPVNINVFSQRTSTTIPN